MVQIHMYMIDLGVESFEIYGVRISARNAMLFTMSHTKQNPFPGNGCRLDTGKLGHWNRMGFIQCRNRKIKEKNEMERGQTEK